MISPFDYESEEDYLNAVNEYEKNERAKREYEEYLEDFMHDEYMLEESE